MNVNDVQQILKELFQEPLTNDRDRHIVFWYDEAAEFTDEIDQITLDDVRVWKFSDDNLFATKYELEINDTSSHFLLYSNQPKPVPREDWFYNLYKLGNEFTSDKLTIFMRKLGIEDDRLRHVFKEYSQFFNSNARFEYFRKYAVETYTEDIIDTNILSVLTRSRLNTMDEIIKSLFYYKQTEEYDAWGAIKRLGNEEKFWALVEKHYGYTLQEKSLESLLTFFIMTYITEQNVDITYPKTWLAYVSARPTNAIVFMDQWMNHQQNRFIFQELSKQVAEQMKVDMHIKEWDVQEWIQFDAFHLFDERVIRFIANQLVNNVGQFSNYEHLIMMRRKSHWYPEYKSEYDALLQAVRLFAKVDTLERFIREKRAVNLFQSYVQTYYKLDTFYRKFYVAFDKIVSKEPFHPLREIVENTYTNWFIQELALQWSNSLQREENEAWFLPDLARQNNFFDDWVQPYIQSDQRVFVIISDALRFEVAKELMDTLNNERKATTDLSVMQGVLPSYTALGMASLLPHNELTMSREGDVIADGVRASSTQNRKQILRNHVVDSNAFTFDEISRMDRNALRKACSRLKVVYIYHNAIDAVGDNPATESGVFASAEDAMNDILTLVNRLVNNLSASNILVTADHGFLYQRDKVTVNQLTPQLKVESILSSRRFIVSETNESAEGTFSYGMDDILQDENKKHVTVPNGVNRFHVQGAGANFVHGGAMLQEMVIPVITFKNDRSKSQLNVIRHVDVKLTNPTRKVTNEIVYLEFFQTSAVEDKVLPLKLRAYFVDENGVEISNERPIIADSTANEAYERTWKERFILKSMPYDLTKDYYLILENEDDTIYERYPFTIDII